MRIGIDTTNQNLCYALVDDKHQLIFSENIYPCQNAAEILAPKIKDMLERYQTQPHDISEIVSVIGPGGFSGVRIGTSFVTGFTAGREIKIISLSSLQAAALSIHDLSEDAIIISCLNARRNGVYIAIFDHNYQRLTDDQVIDMNDIQAFLSPYISKKYALSGHGSELIKPFLDDNLQIQHLEYPLAERFTIHADLIVSSQEHQALYLRLPDAKVSQKKLV